MLEALAVLGFSMAPALLALGVLAVACAVMVVSILGEPQRVWGWIAAGIVLGCGPIFQGLLILDQIAVAVALLALVVHHLGRRRPIRSALPRGRIERWHTLVFGVFMAYMLFQAARGTIVDGFDPQKLRWVLFFLLVWLAGTLRVVGRRNEAEHGRMVARALVTAWIVYLAVYLAWGLLDLALFGDKFSSQLRHWGTPAYTLSPLVIAIPAIFLTLRDPSAGYRRSAQFAVLLSALTVLFFDARVGVLAVVSFMVIAVLFVNWRATLLLAAGSLAALWIVSSLFWSEARTWEFFVSDVFESGSALFAPAEERSTARDWDRVAHLEVAFGTYQDGPVMFLFGTGYRQSGPYVSARYPEIVRSYGVIRATPIATGGSTEAFTALVVETGVIGIGLFLANLGLTAVRVLQGRTGRSRVVLLWATGLLLLWMPVINHLTAIWLFLAIAPAGTLVHLSAVPLMERQRRGPVASSSESVPRSRRLQPAPFPVESR